MRDTKRAQAVRRTTGMIEAVEEHLGDLEKDATPGEAVENDIWRDALERLRAALYAAELPDRNGVVTLRLDCADERRRRGNKRSAIVRQYQAQEGR